MADYVALIVLPTHGSTYEALTKLKNTSDGFGITSAAIVERDAMGRLSVPDAASEMAGEGVVTGSLIGMLIGVLGGPLGMLLGWSAGAASGALVDVNRLSTSDNVIGEFGRLVPPGANAIVAQTNEADTRALDSIVASLGGSISRRPLDEVLGDLEAQQEAAEAARDAAEDAMRKARKTERKEKWDARVEALKARFQTGLDAVTVPASKDGES